MKILVVDDHPVFLAGVEFLIATKHPEYKIELATHADQAHERLSQSRFDLVMVDLNLPDTDGISLIREMNARGDATPTLVMSADIDALRVREALAVGASGFISKAASPRDMLESIHTTAAGDRYLSPELAEAISEDCGNGNSNHGITPRQIAVLELVAAGLSNREIAERLSLTEHTVKSHVRALFVSLKCKNRTACVRTAQRLGIVSNAY